MADAPESDRKSPDVDDAPVVALADDDAALRVLAGAWLRGEGFRVREFASGSAILEADLRDVALVLLDLGLGDVPGADVLMHLRARDPDLPVLVVTSRRDVDTAVACMRLGAGDYLAKPLDPARLMSSVTSALARQRDAETVRREREGHEGAAVLGAALGRSAAMRELGTQIARVLASDVNVCLLGESGVGKEVVARAIHQHGKRRKGPFVAVNCAAIPHSLQETELFGHEKGAFTGATGAHKGRFEQAEDGTLFLDELGEMSPGTQAALLRALQERTIRRVGGNVEVKVNARIVCATHRDLEAEVEAGRFRKDLYFRLVVYPIEIPPLRARRDDIPLLVGHFLRKLRADVGREIASIAPEALEAMARYEWPGNVRELQNVVHRAMLACDGGEIALAHLPPALRKRVLPELPSSPAVATAAPVGSAAPAGTGGPGQLATSDAVVPLAELEKQAIEHAMRVARGSVGKAARLLGIGRTTLYRRLGELGIPPESA